MTQEDSCLRAGKKCDHAYCKNSPAVPEIDEIEEEKEDESLRLMNH